jgi:N-acyl-D-aspartate/D-glutamate deacylase
VLDCIIRGGTVIDGTGAAGIRADLGIKDGQIVTVGRVDEVATRTVDADGLVVSPGFIDIHTHYDAQVMWDPLLVPSSLHGVTTVLGGNCGFTIAPVSSSSSDYIMRMLACVEGIPVESLEKALEFRWNSFGQWLSQLEGNVALNVGFSVGHSTVRRMVMGEDWRQPATDQQIEEMAKVVEESLKAGALGFTSSWSDPHGDHLGNPVPSRFAEAKEVIRLASVLKEFPGTMLEFAPSTIPEFPEPAMQVMTDMAVAAARPLNWNLISVGTGISEKAIEQRLSSCNLAAKAGARMAGLMLPNIQPVWINISLIGFNAFPIWRKILALPVEEKKRALVDPATRAELAKALVGKDQRHVYQFHNMTVERVENQSLKHLEGRRLSDIAKERGCTELDIFIDISVQDDLKAYFKNAMVGDDDESWRLRARLWKDPRVILGGSDAGAHVDLIDSFSYFTDFIGPSVRDRKLIKLEDAVHMITDRPARFFGLNRRGRIAQGWHADITIFDPDSVRPDPVEVRNDLPGGALRLFAGAKGIEHVFVGGEEIVTRGRHTGALPGTVLRSGQDTV